MVIYLFTNVVSRVKLLIKLTLLSPSSLYTTINMIDNKSMVEAINEHDDV